MFKTYIRHGLGLNPGVSAVLKKDVNHGGVPDPVKWCPHMQVLAHSIGISPLLQEEVSNLNGLLFDSVVQRCVQNTVSDIRIHFQREYCPNILVIQNSMLNITPKIYTNRRRSSNLLNSLFVL